MSKYLAVLIWPAGMAVIFGCGLLLSRGKRAASASGSGGHRADAGRHDGSSRRSGLPVPRGAWEAGALVLLAVAGAVAVFAVMCLLGLLVVHHGLAIDKPIFSWVHGHQVHAVAAAMKRLTKIGDTWTAWGAAIAAAVCLSVSTRRRRWLPPVAFASLIVIDHYTTLALRHVFHRIGPPTSPLGTYPSGGCDRCVVFYGLIAYLLWREFSGRRATAVWAACLVAAIGFNEAFSRVYLSLHWFTDALSGLLYGALLLGAFVVAITAVAGPARAVPSHQPADEEQAEVPAGRALSYD
jgi:membrane-associated phospholipid phosphatase